MLSNSLRRSQKSGLVSYAGSGLVSPVCLLLGAGQAGVNLCLTLVRKFSPRVYLAGGVVVRGRARGIVSKIINSNINLFKIAYHDFIPTQINTL